MIINRKGNYFVLFPDTGEQFPVRYYQTSDMYTVELPCGVYEGEYIADLKGALSADFTNVRITSK